MPVLSEQIICAQPRVSTAVSLLMTAFLCDILVTPIESTIVTTATSPSGIAATASEIASMKVSIMTSMLRRPALITPRAKMNAQMTSTSFVRIFES